jgi:hypothetical protein
MRVRGRLALKPALIVAHLAVIPTHIALARDLAADGVEPAPKALLPC